MTFSVPLTVNGTSLADVAAGLHDSSFISVAQSLVAYHWGASTVRLGWEFNGGWMPWAAGTNPQAYVAAYRHVVVLMRSVPGAQFTFDWCSSWGPNATAPDSVYPGDDVVDVIGMDVYNRYYDAADADPAHRWNTFLTASYGLNWLVAFAQLHGKPISIPEWGTGEWLVADGGTGGGDDPLFVTNMSLFLEANSAAYSSYWDISASGYNAEVSDGEHPLSGAALKAAFGTVLDLPGQVPWLGAGQAATATTISINFAPPNDGGIPTSYVILDRITGQGSWTTYGTVGWTGWQTVSGLLAGTSYDFEVYAVNASGNGAVSAPVTLATVGAPAAPTAPLPVPTPVPTPVPAPVPAPVAKAPLPPVPGQIPWIGMGQASTTTTISINFAPPNDGGTPSSYVILDRVTGQGAWTTYGAVGWTGWQTVSGLLPGTSYDFEVYASNAGGDGEASSVLTLATIGTPPPGQIPWIGAGQAATTTTISINFAPPNDGGTPSAYVILDRVTGQSAWTTCATVGWTGWQTVAGLLPGTSYDFEVYATNSGGSGEASSVLTLATLGTATPPPGQIPWIGIGQAATATTISINFAPPNVGGTPTSYLILYRNTGLGGWGTYGVVTWTGWQTVSGLSPGVSYDFQVTASNAGGSGAPSAVLTASTL
jgi:hypothetical protein